MRATRSRRATRVRATLAVIGALSVGLSVSLHSASGVASAGGVALAGGVAVAASDSENRGTVTLNEDGDGVILTATKAGKPSGRVRTKKCTAYRPVLRYEYSNVVPEDIRPQSDQDALVKRGEDDNEQILLERTCSPIEDPDSGGADSGGSGNNGAANNGGARNGAGNGAGNGGGDSGGADSGGTRVRVNSYQESHWASLKQLVGELARSAMDTIFFPATRARFSPPAKTRTLVGVDTWFWVPATSWKPIVRVVGVAPVVVTAVATPVALRLNPGDGSAATTCPGPGLPWVPGGRTLCSHVYQRASTRQASTSRVGGRFNAVVTTVWRVHWTSTTGASGTIGPIHMPQINSVKVAEAEAVLGT